MTHPAVFLLLWAAAQCLAGAKQVAIVVRPEKVKFEDTFTATLTVPGRCSVEEFPASDQYEVVSKRSRKNQALGLIKTGISATRFEHQSRGYDTVYTYVLRPMKGGTITINPISAHCGDLDLETPRRAIQVDGGPKGLQARPSPEPAPKQEAGAGPGDIPHLQDFTPAPVEPVAPPPLVDPIETKLLRGPATPAEEGPGKQSLEQLAALKREAAPYLTPEARRTLIRVGEGFLGPLMFILFVPWKWIAKRWRETRKSTFARDPALPSIAIRREEGVIGGKYKLDKEIGSGGMGLVYLAQDLKLMRSVAVKKMRSELQFNQEQRQNFVREAMIISRLSHPYIVAIHEIVEQDGDIYMIFDYVDGKPLSAVIDEKKPLTLKFCQDIFSYVCQAVDFAHKNNVLHQDLKPSNIMVDANGFAKVMDFGLAREAKVATNEIWGTLAYMAPERHMGAGTALADVYSLGVCLYEMLAGRLPFPGPEFQSQKENMQFDALTKLRPDLPKGIDALLAAALAPSPKDRTAGAVRFLEELKKL